MSDEVEPITPQKPKPEYIVFKNEAEFEYLGNFYHVKYGSTDGIFYVPLEFVKDDKPITKAEFHKAITTWRIVNQIDPTAGGAVLVPRLK